MNRLSRRDFLKTTVASFALLSGGVLALEPLKAWADNAAAAGDAAKKEYWVLCDTAETTADKEIFPVVTNPGAVKAFDVSSGEIVQIDLPFFGHAGIQNPARPQQVMVFEKWGRRGALVDLKEKAVVTSIDSVEGNVFFGHAAFISGGDFVTSEDNYDHVSGQLTVRDPTTLKPIQKMSSYGTGPHQCRALDDGKTILVVNEGGGKNKTVPPNVSWVEAASGKQLHQVDLDYGAGTLFGHVGVSSDGWLCVVGFHPPRTLTSGSRVAFVSPDGRVLRPRLPQEVAMKMKGEVLSVAFLGDSGLVAVTLPDSGRVVIYKYKTQEYVTEVHLPGPKGVLAYKNGPNGEPAMIVSSSKKLNLEKITLEGPDKKPSKKVFNSSFGGKGSHLSRIYI